MLPPQFYVNVIPHTYIVNLILYLIPHLPCLIKIFGLLLSINGCCFTFKFCDHFHWCKYKLDFKELGDIEQHREDDYWHHIGKHYPPPRVHSLALVVVLYWSPDSPVPLQGQSHGDVDGAAEDKVVQRVETIAKSILMKLKKEKKDLT
jgi:hypothetical protein